MLIPFPDSMAVMISTYIDGNDEESRLLKRTIMRYINLSIILAFQTFSLPVKKRFPSMEHLEEAGIILSEERKVSQPSRILYYVA